jgi:hypothetical protein
MNMQELHKSGVFEEIVRCFPNQDSATILSSRVGYTGPAQFTGDPRRYWLDVCTGISDGIVAECGQDLQPLINEAACIYPGNQIFASKKAPTPAQAPDREGEDAPDAGETREPATPQACFVSILAQGFNNAEELLSAARDAAQQLQMDPNTIGLGFSNAEGILLDLLHWSPENADQLAALLREGRQGQRISVGTSPYRDYLLRLIVRGPDDAEFELPDVRASTPVRDVVAGVVGAEYADKKGRGWQGSRIAQARQIDKTGRQRPLDPNKSLHDEGVKFGDTIELGVESRAGAIDPALREQALARAFHQVMRYAKDHPGFIVSTNSDRVPTEYLFEFSIPSFAPPLTKGGPPQEVDDHQVFLTLLADFPMKAPLVFWQTPIFHPNIHRDKGKVCLGILDDAYKPSMDFGDLCNMLVNVAGYRNYAIKEAYDIEALKWVRTPEGQLAIERRGGYSVVRDFLDQHYIPRPINIRPIG